MNKTFYIENLGCAKNQVDAETIIFMLGESGWSRLDSPDEAGLIIVNTCGFISSAKQESVDTVLEFRSKYPDKKILFAGCMAQRYGDRLHEDFEEIDGVFGNSDLSLINEVVDLLWSGNRPLMLPSKPSIPEKDSLQSFKRKDLLSFPGSAYVKIAEGCSNLCSFCAIPLIRGKIDSRLIDSIIQEIKGLLASGIKEINLIAQDLSSFGMDRGQKDLPELLREISKLEGDFWIRLLYIHPDYFQDEILDIMAEDTRILPYFDLPFQHVTPKILRQMNRKGSSESYSELISKIRQKLPNSTIRSTFMVGFPGDNILHYRELALFLENSQLDWVGFFVYSREENTKAYDYGFKGFDKMRSRIARYRKKSLEILQQEITVEKLNSLVDTVVPVLIEEEIPDEDLYIGRSSFQAPDVDGYIVVEGTGLTPGEIYTCRIVRRNGFDLSAVIEK
ncbi:MAG: 30S ribosomal protein S12 methylthiotransferase RimO [Spirochaetales bacterium]|nr:30S ribosomal protein S12 methylthiotransferase RimO [Spirochaetales bacterium]